MHLNSEGVVKNSKYYFIKQLSIGALSMKFLVISFTAILLSGCANSYKTIADKKADNLCWSGEPYPIGAVTFTSANVVHVCTKSAEGYGVWMYLTIEDGKLVIGNRDGKYYSDKVMSNVISTSS